MPIEVICRCGATYRLRDELAGKNARCSKCRATMIIPEADMLVAPASAPEVPQAIATPAANFPAIEFGPESLKAPGPRRGTRSLLLASALTVATALLSGATWWLTRPEPARSARKVGGRLLSAEEVVAKVEKSVCRVSGQTGSGSGFVVAPGLIATNAHVVRGQPVASLEVAFAAREGGPAIMAARVVAFDEERDLAFLRVESTPPPLEIAPPEPFRRGQDVVIIGNPGLGDAGVTLENAVSRGVLSTRLEIDGQVLDQLGASINPGNSGGPILDMKGRVVGVAVARARKEESVAFCIPGDDLREAVERCRSLTPQAIARAAKAHEQTLKSEFAGTFGEAYGVAPVAKKLAMVQRAALVEDGDPMIGAFREFLGRAASIYRQSEDEIGGITLAIVGALLKEKRDARPGDVLEALIEAVPRRVAGAPPFDCYAFGRSYLTFRRNNGSHEAAMTSMRELSGLIEAGLVDEFPQYARRRGPAPERRIPVATEAAAAPSAQAASSSAAAVEQRKLERDEKAAAAGLREANELRKKGLKSTSNAALKKLIAAYPATAAAEEARSMLQAPPAKQKPNAKR